MFRLNYFLQDGKLLTQLLLHVSGDKALHEQAEDARLACEGDLVGLGEACTPIDRLQFMRPRGAGGRCLA